MADSYPTLCKTTTNTTGTNNYVLATANSAGPYQTPKQAKVRGSLADGAIVHYLCRDPEVLGDASFERGLGVYTDSTNTVTRLAANVLDGSNGPGVLVTWALTGTRDFYILGAVPELLVHTTGDEIIAGAKTFSGPVSVAKPSGAVALIVQTGDASIADVILTNSVTSWLLRIAASGNFQLFKTGTGGVGAFIINAAAPNSALTIGAAEITAGVAIKNASGVPYENFAGSGATALVFYQAAAPTGWTKSTTNNDKALRAVSGSGGVAGGTLALSSANVGATSLSIAQMPAHTHTIDRTTNQAVGGSGAKTAEDAGGFANDTATNSAGSGDTHTHSLALAYIDVIVCSKN
jgi:hypothetical protein